MIDLDSGETYAASEDGIRAWQHSVSAFSIALSHIISRYENTGFMELAQRHGAVTDHPYSMVFSVTPLANAVGSARGPLQPDAERAYRELRTLADQGQLARWGPGHKTIELAKPVQEAGT